MLLRFSYIYIVLHPKSIGSLISCSNCDHIPRERGKILTCYFIHFFILILCFSLSFIYSLVFFSFFFTSFLSSCFLSFLIFSSSHFNFSLFLFFIIALRTNSSGYFDFSLLYRFCFFTIFFYIRM